MRLQVADLHISSSRNAGVARLRIWSRGHCRWCSRWRIASWDRPSKAIFATSLRQTISRSCASCGRIHLRNAVQFDGREWVFVGKWYDATVSSLWFVPWPIHYSKFFFIYVFISVFIRKKKTCAVTKNYNIVSMIIGLLSNMLVSFLLWRGRGVFPLFHVFIYLFITH